MPRLISLGVMLALIIALGIPFFRVVAPFFLPLFLGAMTAIVCQPIYKYFLSRTKNREGIAAALTTTALLTAVLAPLIIGTIIAAMQFSTVASELNRESVKPVLDNIVGWGVEHVNEYRSKDQQIKADDVSKSILTWFQNTMDELRDRSLGNVAGTTLGVLTGAAGVILKAVIGLAMYCIALFYFFADGTKLLRAGESMIPVNVEYQRQLIVEFGKVVRSVVLSTFLAALAQGLATTVAVGVLGFHHLIALFALATFAALVPLVGTWIVWLPCTIWLFSHGHPVQGFFLALYCIVFVGLIDNIVRTYVLNTNTKLHPLLAFVSVLGGIEALGLWGVFIGPIIACCLHALIKIFNLELHQLSRERMQETNAPAIATAAVSPGVPDPAVVEVVHPAAAMQTTPSHAPADSESGTDTATSKRS